MAIRDKFRRAVGTSRKSTTSSSSSSSTHAAETASTTESETSSSSASSSSSSTPISSVTDRKSHARTFPWRTAKSADEKEQKKNKKTHSDPREKPFTEMNLRYQQILGSYELTFGTSRPEQLWNPDGELSPGTSRQNSIDLGRN